MSPGLALFLYGISSIPSAGTVAEIEPSDQTVNMASAPLNRTAVTPVKPKPVIVTVAPSDGGCAPGRATFTA